MPLKFWKLSDDIIRNIDLLLKDNDITEWYNSYRWQNDTISSAFCDIVDLEYRISEAAKTNNIPREYIFQIAEWGGHPMFDKIQILNDISLPLYDNGSYASWIKNDPAHGLVQIRPQVKFLGPTYMTKVLRFALPSEFGALDTRITRVFGKGDPDNAYLPLLKLEAEDQGWKWFIKYPQPAWPSEYSTFTYILRYIADFLNRSEIPCPHPKYLYDNNMRSKGVWECADVEMAMFSFASERIYPHNTNSGSEKI